VEVKQQRNARDDAASVAERRLMGARINYGPVMIMPRGLFDDDERLSQEDFRAKLRDLGIIEELERRELWLGDETASNVRGLGFRDFEEFYSHRLSPKAILSRTTLQKSGTQLRESARLIAQALDAYRWASSLGVITPFDYEEHWIILRSHKTGDDMVAPGTIIEDDVLEHLVRIIHETSAEKRSGHS
jgi:hypothetical protein